AHPPRALASRGVLPAPLRERQAAVVAPTLRLRRKEPDAPLDRSADAPSLGGGARAGRGGPGAGAPDRRPAAGGPRRALRAGHPGELRGAGPARAAPGPV